MKKFLLLALSLLTALTLSFAVACNGDDSSLESSSESASEIEESTGSGNGGEEVTLTNVEYVSGIGNLELGADVELDELVLKLSYSDGSEENVAYDELDKSALTVSCDTTKLGATAASISYKGFTADADLRVYCMPSLVDISSSFKSFYAAKGEESNYKDKTQAYKVGDDGLFYFGLIVTAYSEDGEDLYSFDESEVEIVANLYVLTDGEYVLVENTADYVEIDALNASFDFAESAINNTFKIVAYPKALEDAGLSEAACEYYSKSIEIAVVDGYNVYNAAELLLWDNANEDVAKFRANKGVTADASAINSLVLHDNIVLGVNDIPSVFIYDRERDADEFAGLSEEKKNRLQGSLKDDVFIMLRSLGETGQFTFEGNYFTVDASAAPYIMKGRDNETLDKDPKSIVSHVSLFCIQGKADENSDVASENFDIRNVNFLGNLNRTENIISSGGLILVKLEHAKGTTYNVVSKGWYTNTFITMNAVGHEVTIDSCVFEDSYNCLIYAWGGLMNIKNSRIYGAGGPAIIADHAYAEENRGRTGTNGWISELTVDDLTEIASYVTGQEAWFAEFNAQGAVGSIMSADAIFNSFGKTFITITKDEGGNEQQLLNLAILFKSGSAEGMTADPILAKLKIGENHVLDFRDPYTAAFLSGLAGWGAPIFQGATTAGLIAYAGNNTTPGMTDIPILYTLTGIQTMTPVNFLAGEHLSLPIAQDSGYLNLFYAPQGSQGYMGIVLGDYRALK